MRKSIASLKKKHSMYKKCCAVERKQQVYDRRVRRVKRKHKEQYKLKKQCRVKKEQQVKDRRKRKEKRSEDSSKC